MLYLIRHQRARLEAIALAITGVVLAHLALIYELHEKLDHLAHENGWFVVDQLFISLIIAGILGLVFGVLRFRDLRREISRRRQAEQQTLWAARHDALTGLQNRQGLEEIASADCLGCRYAVFSIDLVGFKRTNDLVGHAGGDELLVNIARRLEQIFAPEDVYRLGGDEFLALCRKADDVDLDQLGQQLTDSISVPMRASGITTEVGANVGYARFPQDGETIREVIRCSDIAMYAAKKSGRNNVLAFTRSMGDGLSKRVELENALLHAVRNDLIVPYYQPLVDLQSGKILGFEALARWYQPGDGECVPPCEFIEIAEEAGLITELSEKVLRRACRDAMSWPADIRLAFNLSPTQLADKLLGLRLMTILDEVGLPPHRLELEITESALIQNSSAAEAVLRDLSEAGIKIALDDFGTGYSSFAHLLRFKFDKIKIDRSFVHQMNSDERHRRIVQSILGLSRNLGIPATAEGIESDGQRHHLRNMGCDVGQGFLFSEAIPAGAVQTLLLHPIPGTASLIA